MPAIAMFATAASLTTSRCVGNTLRGCRPQTPSALRVRGTRPSLRIRAPMRQLRSSNLIVAALNKGDSVTDYSSYEKSLKTSTGKSVSLSSLKGKQPVVLFFYPKAGTPGCTKQARKFNDDYSKFKKAGAAVFGISGDSLDDQKKFASDESLQYPLLVDEGDALRKDFGIKSDMLGMLPGRQTYVIGKDGTCLLSFNDQLGAEKHSAEALKALGA